MSPNPSLWRRAAVAVAIAGVLSASVTVRADDAEKPWDRSFALGLAVATGNTDTMLFNAGIKGEKLWKADELRLGAAAAYGRSDGSLATETLQGILQYKHLFSERMYGTIVADAIHDSVADVEYRLTVGPGAGYYFIKSDKTRLSGEAGPSAVFEKTDVVHPNQVGVDFVTSDKSSYIAARVSERFEHKLNENAKVWQQTDWLAQVDDFKNYLLITEAGIEAALTKAMSLRVVGTHRYDGVTPDSKRHYDLTLVSAIAYKF